MAKSPIVAVGGNNDVEAELSRLSAMPIVELRSRYRELFRADPPKAFGPDLLRRSIAHRIQEKAYGGLCPAARRVLDQLVKAYTAKPNGRLNVPRRIKPGSILVRNWKGRSYRVTVMVDGFAFDGRTYGNLSEVAQHITGTRWNGPRFFGLRTKEPEGREPAARKQPLGGGSDYRRRNAALKVQLGRQGRHNHGL